MISTDAPSRPASFESVSLVLERVERVLSGHLAFGKSDHICDQLSASLQGALQAIAPRIQVAGQLADALQSSDCWKLSQDMVLRAAVMRIANYLATSDIADLSLAECTDILTATLASVEAGKRESPIQDGSLQRLGHQPYFGYIWNDDHSDDLFGSAFRKLILANYDALPCTPTADEVQALQDGANLLVRVLPLLGPSALTHAAMTAYVPKEGKWRSAGSSSQIKLSGTIFLSRHLQNPWTVAEHLLHESLHQKLYALQVCESILDPQDRERVRTTIPWNPSYRASANEWDTHRVLAAFHVYVHLALLALVAENCPPEFELQFGPPRLIAAETALQRAQFLGERLSTACSCELGIAGRELVKWLKSVLAVLDSASAPECTDLHLRLDLYARETAQLQDLLWVDAVTDDKLLAACRAAADSEVQATRELLAMVSSPDLLNSFDLALDRTVNSTPVQSLLLTRLVIAESLADAAESKYVFSNDSTINDSLNRTLERASDRLYTIHERAG